MNIISYVTVIIIVEIDVVVMFLLRTTEIDSLRFVEWRRLRRRKAEASLWPT